jgi:hypothetical protein
LVRFLFFVPRVAGLSKARREGEADDEHARQNARATNDDESTLSWPRAPLVHIWHAIHQSTSAHVNLFPRSNGRGMASDAENDESSVRSSSSGSDSSRARRQHMKAARQRKDGQRAKKKRCEYQMTVLQKKILEEADRCKPGVGRGRTGAMTLESFCTHLLRLPEFADRKTISRKSITRVLDRHQCPSDPSLSNVPNRQMAPHFGWPNEWDIRQDLLYL